MNWVFLEYRHFSDERVMAEKEIQDIEEAWIVPIGIGKNIF